MLLFLLLTLTVSVALQSSTHTTAALKEDGKRPNIYHCRSPNMEIFTCWWRPITNEDNVTYTLLYTTGKSAPRECPDYVSGGANSCFFDVEHTQVWEMYCMNVTAHTRTGPINSQTHCLDVVNIVETDPPSNLTYIMLNESIGEAGHSILVSWLHPIESPVHEGLMILIYELRYRNLAQTDSWRVMEHLHEPHVEFLNLPEGSYEFSVRCSFISNKHWSAWSESITVNISGGALSDWMLALILVTSITIIVFIIIILGNIPQGKRIKSFLLPAIPKPRIPGLDPALLKKGKIDEINQHFSSFHGYELPSSVQSYGSQQDVPIMPITQYVTCPNGQQSVQTSCTHAPYCCGPSPSPCGEEDTPPPNSGHTSYREKDTPPPDPGPASYHEEDSHPPDPGAAHPELVSVPGMDYSIIVNPAPAAPPTHDFYTCVKAMTPSGALHLVPYLQLSEGVDDEVDKSSQLTALMEKQMEALLNPTESDPSEAAMPSLARSSDRSCRSIS